MTIIMAMTLGFLITGFTLDTNVWNVTCEVTRALLVSALALGGVGGRSLVTDSQVSRNPTILYYKNIFNQSNLNFIIFFHKKFSVQGQEPNIFVLFLKVGTIELSSGMFCGSSLTMKGDKIEPIIPPTAPEHAMKAVDINLSFSANQA